MLIKLKIIILIMCGLSIMIVQSSSAQNRDTWSPPPFPQVSRELLFSDPLVFYGNDGVKARLDIYIEIPIPVLIFKRNPSNDLFESSIEMTLSIEDSKTRSFTNKVFKELTSFSNEEMKSEAKNSIYFLKVFNEKPGNYKLNLKVKDNNSNSEYLKQDSIIIKDISGVNIVFSDIMILSDYKISSEGKKEITPLVNNNVFSLKDFFIFFEIYNYSDTVAYKEYIYQIKNSKDKIISEGSLSYNLLREKNKEFEKLKFSSSEPGIYKLQILDKSSQELVAEKKFTYLPHPQRPGMMPREGHRPN